MAANQANQSVTQPNKWGLFMIFGSLIAVIAVFIIAIIIFRAVYNTASDITPVIEATITAISTIAAAAFGVSIGTQAGAQAGQATANATKEQTNRTKQQISHQMQHLTASVNSVHDEIRRFPYRQPNFSLKEGDFNTPDESFSISEPALTDIQTRIEAIQSLLQTLPS